MSKRKTPLGELFEKIIEIRESSDPLYSLAFVVVEVKKLLPKEREVIIKAADSHCRNGEQYFNENFVQ